MHILISNLVSNAIKYNKKGGEIEIVIDSWSLTIKDTGIGIPQKDLEKIFDRFYQVGNIRNQKWFWIWLALVRKIVDVYGWKTDIFSKEKVWTTIKIKFN
jgi:signal transduction histidine kinase